MKQDYFGIIISAFVVLISIISLRPLGTSITVVVVAGILLLAITITRILFKIESISEQEKDTQKVITEPDKIVSKERNTEETVCLTVIPVAIDLVGRERDIQEINAMLSESPIVTIVGEGGIGKTAVARSIINKEKEKILLGESQYKHVVWINNTGDIKKNFLTIHIPDMNPDLSSDEKILYIINWLQNHPSFIVIDEIDYIKFIKKEDIDFLNALSGKTRILITTRAHISAFRVFCLYNLNKLNKKSCLELFYRCYLNNSRMSYSRMLERTDKASAEGLVDIAGYNTLLIELIGKMACWEYIDRLDELRSALEKNVFGTDSEIEIETDHASHLSISDLNLQGQIRNLYRISGLNETQQELLRFISAFPAETIIFAKAFKWAGFSVTDLQYLTDRGWIEKSGEGYLIHTMVQGSVKLQKSDFDIEKYDNLIKKLSNIDQYISEDTVYSKVRERIVVPETVCTLLEEKGSQEQETATMYNNIAGVYHAQGDYEKALGYYKKSLAISEKLLGPDHPGTAATYNNIAGVYHAQGDYEKALGYYKKSLAIREKLLGPDHPDTAATYNNIAGVYQAQGDYEKALEYNKKDLVVSEKVLGPDHPDTATTYNNIAGVYQAQGDYGKALEYNKKALAIRKNVLGPDHPDTATTYNNIAGVYQAQGDYEKALEYNKKALAIIEKVLGPDHPDTAAMYNNIALVYKAQGDYEKALEYNKKALAIRDKVLGPDHPDTATTYNNIALLYHAQGNYERALEYNKKALAIIENVLGSDHPDTATTYNNIAGVYQAQGDYEKALEYNKKALAIIEKVLGPDHPNTATTYNNIALLYHAQGDYEKALKYYKKDLAICEKVLGPEHPNTATTYNNIGRLYYDMDDYVKAKQYWQRAYDVFLILLGDGHPYTKISQKALKAVMKELGE